MLFVKGAAVAQAQTQTAAASQIPICKDTVFQKTAGQAIIPGMAQRAGGFAQMSANFVGAESLRNHMFKTLPNQSPMDTSISKASKTLPSSTGDVSGFMASRKRPTINQRSSQLQMTYKSNGLHGMMNMSVSGRKITRSSNVAMHAGFSTSGVPLTRKTDTNSQDEFTITHLDNKVENPWGFRRQTTVMMAEATLNQDNFVPDMQRRTIMNLVLLGGAAVPVRWMGGGFIYFFVPPKGASGGGALKALDANGDVVKNKAWLAAQ